MAVSLKDAEIEHVNGCGLIFVIWPVDRQYTYRKRAVTGISTVLRSGAVALAIFEILPIAALGLLFKLRLYNLGLSPSSHNFSGMNPAAGPPFATVRSLPA